MVDLLEKDKGNISLSMKLQSWDDEKEKSKPTIINTQKAFYSIKIEDIENRINRLEKRNDELLDEIEDTDERLVTTDAETADEIASLSKQFYLQNDKVENLKHKIDSVENNRIENKLNHDNKVELLNQRYQEKKIELVSEIKILTAKINALEDFKRTSSLLEEKFEINEKQMMENEEKVKKLLEDVNQKFEFDKEMLKNEMYCCLLDLAAQFQLQTDKYISLPNKRLMRENVMLKNELSQISKQVSVENNIHSILKNSVVNHKGRIIEKSSDVKQNIITTKVQNSVLTCLKNKYENTKKYFSSINIPDLTMKDKYLVLIENARHNERITDVRLSKLKRLLEKERIKINTAKYVYGRLNCKIKAIIETLYDLKYIVRCLIKCPDKYPELLILSGSELLLFLQNIYCKGQSKICYGITKSIETIPHEVEFHTDLGTNITKYEDFEIMTESEEEQQLLDEMKLNTETNDQTEISTESSDLEEQILDISEDNVSFDSKHEDDEYLDEQTSSTEE